MSVTPEPTPPVPAGWWRDAPPRSREQLIAAHLDRLPEWSGDTIVAVINAAWSRVELATVFGGAPDREVFLAAMLAELATRDPS